MPLTKERNDLLCLVDNGAPMGRMLKANFWVPALLSMRLVSDGPPEAVRLFGKNYVAFRSTDGRVGFFDASLQLRRHARVPNRFHARPFLD